MKFVKKSTLKNRHEKIFINMKHDRKNTMRRQTQLVTIKKLTEWEQAGEVPAEGDFPSEPKFLKKGTNKDFIFSGNFHEAIAPVLVMAQCFAVMPVKGVRSKDPSGLSFSWLNYRTIYSILVLLALNVQTGLTIYEVASQSVEFDKIEPVIFGSSIIVVFANFLYLSRKWPKLMRKWEDVEREIPPFETQNEKAALANKIKIVTFVIMMLSLTEHMLSIISVVHSANYCPINRKDPIESFFRVHLSPIFHVFDFSLPLAFFGLVISTLATFSWNFMDCFVTVISIGLSSKFKQLNDSMVKIKGKPMPKSYWIENRINFRKLCILCEEIDNAISIITMVSFSNNLYFICIQLLKSLNKMPSVAHTVYFWFSLSFLIGRTLAVSLFAADINDESKRPLDVFRSVPKESWCNEVKRFFEEVATDTVALSGMRFFYLTRKLVLSVAGTIVTYELVLIQFHEDKPVVIECHPPENFTIPI